MLIISFKPFSSLRWQFNKFFFHAQKQSLCMFMVFTCEYKTDFNITVRFILLRVCNLDFSQSISLLIYNTTVIPA